MNLPLPNKFHPDLTEDRLSFISNILLEEYYKTEDELTSEFDDNYTRGCTVFGRQKNRIKKIAVSGTYDWLTIVNSSNDLVFKIGIIPCRFSTDDPQKPCKNAVINIHQAQIPFIDEADSNEPSRFCFILDKGMGNSDDPVVVLLGFDEFGIEKCRWVSDAIRVFKTITANIPSTVEIAKPSISPKRSVSHNDQAKNDL